MREEPRKNSNSIAQSPKDTHLTGPLSTPPKEQHQGEVGQGDTCLGRINANMTHSPRTLGCPNSACLPLLRDPERNAMETLVKLILEVY